MNTRFLSIFLPNDEYKKHNIVTYMAESTILLLIFHTVMLIVNRSIHFSLDNTILLFSSVIFPVIYILARYIISGIEYANVFTKDEYKNNRKEIFLSGLKFTCLFFILWILLIETPSSTSDWLNTTGLTLLVFLFFNLINFISLKVSYMKNQRINND